ncbi:hypothetical protein D9M72_524140 [compost metagenome]
MARMPPKRIIIKGMPVTKAGPKSESRKGPASSTSAPTRSDGQKAQRALSIAMPASCLRSRAMAFETRGPVAALTANMTKCTSAIVLAAAK